MAAEKAKVVVMTGATGVIGEAIAEGFKTANLMAPTVSRLILICRSAARGEKVAAKLRGSLMKVDVIVADLSSPSSVSACATELAAKHPKIDVLVNNAAVVPTRREETADGLEMQFAVNVLAYFALMRGLLPSMSSGARVVLVASNLAGGLDTSNLQCKGMDPYRATDVYSRTKQANRMLAAEAAMPGRGFAEKGVLVTSCHPGVVTSPLLQNLGFSSGFQPAASGAQTPLKLALSVPPENGSFWVDKQKTKCKFASDLAGRQALWEACEALVGGVVSPS